MGTSLFFHISRLQIVCRFRKRWAPKNDEDPFNKVSKIMDMGPISIKKHERIRSNMVPISITKHEMFFWEFRNVDNCGIVFLGPKQSSVQRVFIKTSFYNGGILSFSEV